MFTAVRRCLLRLAQAKNSHFLLLWVLGAAFWALGARPLKDEKTAFSAFLLFQITFHSKSFAPRI
jgi:hypothetical protein